MNTELSIKELFFQKTLLDYWESSGRKYLPWRQTRDPWKILLAEVLLRKTTSQQAVQLYQDLSILSPQDIATVPTSVLASMLKPLGLYNVRAAQLKTAAQQIIDNDLAVLSDPQFLASLPGIGKYISSTILCFSIGLDTPALDTNMIRLLERVFSYKTKRSRAREDKDLWSYAKHLVPKDFSREYNWGVLDFAASVCTARNPKCISCPISQICNYVQKAD